MPSGCICQKAPLLMWIITSFKYFTEFSLYRQFHECAKIISECMYQQVCCCCDYIPVCTFCCDYIPVCTCCCDYIPVCNCCCDYIPVCTCFTTMVMRSAMTKAARTMYAMTTITTELLTTERLHCLRPSRSFQLENVAWRAACNAGVALHQPTCGGVVEEHACGVIFIPLCQQDRHLLPSRLASMVPISSM